MSPTVFPFIVVKATTLDEDNWMTHPLIASATMIKKIDVAFDASTLHGTFAKDADYMATLAELIRPSGPY